MTRPASRTTTRSNASATKSRSWLIATTVRPSAARVATIASTGGRGRPRPGRSSARRGRRPACPSRARDAIASSFRRASPRSYGFSPARSLKPDRLERRVDRRIERRAAQPDVPRAERDLVAARPREQLRAGILERRSRRFGRGRRRGDPRSGGRRRAPARPSAGAGRSSAGRASTCPSRCGPMIATRSPGLDRQVEPVSADVPSGIGEREALAADHAAPPADRAARRRCASRAAAERVEEVRSVLGDEQRRPAAARERSAATTASVASGSSSRVGSSSTSSRGRHREHRGDRDELRLAARQAGGLALGEVLDPDGRERRADRGDRLGHRTAEVDRPERDLLEDRAGDARQLASPGPGTRSRPPRARAASTVRRRRRGRRRSARRRSRPARARAATRQSVDLPASFGPTRPTISPSSIARSTPSIAGRAAARVAVRDAAELEHRPRLREPRQRRRPRGPRSARRRPRPSPARDALRRRVRGRPERLRAARAARTPRASSARLRASTSASADEDAPARRAAGRHGGERRRSPRCRARAPAAPPRPSAPARASPAPRRAPPRQRRSAAARRPPLEIGDEAARRRSSGAKTRQRERGHEQPERDPRGEVDALERGVERAELEQHGRRRAG